MALPRLIEIEPLPGPVRAEVTVPGSKSLTNRALVLAALAAGETELRGALWSEDTQVMTACLQELGFLVTVRPDPAEPGNRIITVYGQAGRVPRGGTDAQPLELFVGNAGTAARFLSALVCLGDGTYRLGGVPRMHQRPQAALLAALRDLGYQVTSPNNRLPVLIRGAGPRRARCRVSIAESSQFASALLLGAKAGGWQIEVEGEAGDEDEAPYVRMTRELCRVFPHAGGVFQVEPDASSGSYFWGVNALWPPGESPTSTSAALAGHPAMPPGRLETGAPGAAEVTVPHWPTSGWQVDARFPRFLPLPAAVSRRGDLGDSILTAMVLAPWAERPTRFTDLGRLRVQECERVAAMRTELAKCGARVEESGDTLTIWPGRLHGAEIATYDDHRVAMSFAILGLKVPGIRLQNPACVKKTFPNFFQKLAAPPPRGLGAVIREAPSGRRLTGEELEADSEAEDA